MPSSDPGVWQLIFKNLYQVFDSRVTAVHAVLLHTGKILYYHMHYFPPLSAYFDYTLQFPDAITEQVPPIDYETVNFIPLFFCSGQITMDDGTVIAAGGEHWPPPDIAAGLRYTYIYDPNAVPFTNPWTKVQDMNLFGPVGNQHGGRWYPTLTGWVDPLDNNKFKVIAMSGFTDEGNPGVAHLNVHPEMYNRITNQWETLPAAADMPLNKNYPGAHVIPYGPNAGKIFYSMPMSQARTFDPKGTNGIFWEIYGDPSTPYEKYSGNSVLLPILPNQEKAKVLILGGNGGGEGFAYDTAFVIELNNTFGQQNWQAISSLTYARANSNAILLPDQTLLVVGGNGKGSTVSPVFFAELLDISDQENLSSQRWQTLAAADVPRNYHSSALLLPDASVICMGGRLTSIDPEFDKPFANDFESDIERRFEIYRPACINDGERPIIDLYPNPDTNPIHYSQSFTVTLLPPTTHSKWVVNSVVLIRPGSCTHALDMEQRMIILDFSQRTNVIQINAAPASPNIALPGYYMLFVTLDKTQSISQQSKIPSEAKFVKLIF